MKKALESPENKKCIKAINFDLETKRVKEIFHSNSPYIYLKAYQLVSKFLKSNDFKHRQFSGYISSKKMSDAEILNIAYKLNDELPWFSKCVKKFDVTDVGEQHDLMYIFQKPEKSKLQSKSVETKENKTKGKAPISRKQIKNNAKIITQKNTVSKEKQTDILKADAEEWYQVYPERFQNKSKRYHTAPLARSLQP